MSKGSMNLKEPPTGITKRSGETPLRKGLGGTPFSKAIPQQKSKRRSSRSPIGRRT